MSQEPGKLLFAGRSLRVTALDEGFAELCFDREGDSINKLDEASVREVGVATAILAAAAVRGVLVTSAKSVFIVGADITEFSALFKLDLEALAANIASSNDVFNAFEDLPFPTVAALNGFALGGGLEMALSACMRVMSTQAQVGVPEVKLGLFPGFGGTVRLCRVASPAIAVEWVASGKQVGAQAALEAGVVDLACEPSELRDTALALLRRAAAGEIDWASARERKRQPLAAGAPDAILALRPKVAKASGKHQPAALAALDMMARAVTLDRAGALRLENQAFAAVAKTQAADAMVQTFLSDQVLKKLFKAHAKKARPVRHAAVLGAGIMGGGIAYTSAQRGIPVCMKDIAHAQLDLGMGEASKQLARLVKVGRLAQDEADAVLANIRPTLDYDGFQEPDVVIEAIVENLGVKHKVLAELEQVVRPDTVIASNTSSLRIDDIARPLTRPENFVGMHFFNPVPVMPLVEVIQGGRTTEAAVSTAVGLAVGMGKTPIVVKDCPGFLVNRILTAYIRGFLQLVADGADFVQIDKVLEAFGWPMGPAHLEDVIGLDTGSHVNDLISAGYPDRMPYLEHDALRLLASQGRYGQKNGVGFYRYHPDAMGKPVRSIDADSRRLLSSLQLDGPRDFSDEEIIERVMLPMIIEAAHALEQGVVGSAAELDMALLLGIGYPAYLGGALKYADWLGLSRVVERAVRYASLSPAYQPSAGMREMAAAGRRYYGA
jgi:3-hydroxyacyl-CoA dehydrogenase/enoyl-CoA hydratase/3-hydroxybutyryl-CoA epimerase/enoyl-CoA isomerase